jgi:3-dehydrosphinganine reductase
VASEIKYRLTRRARDYFDLKTVLVTGGSSGIGKSICLALATAGASVTILARDPEKMGRTVAELESQRQRADQRFCSRVVDLRDFDATQKCIAELEYESPVSCLINSAGVALPGKIIDQPVRIIADTINTNLLGCIHTVKAVLPGFCSRNAGHIINISSVAGFVGVFGYSSYCSSKFGLTGFSEAIRAELKRHNIRVSLVCPPETDTPMLAKERELQPVESRRISASAGMMSPEQVAAKTLEGAARGEIYIFPNLMSRLSFAAKSYMPGMLNRYLNYLSNAGSRAGAER